MQYFPIRPTAFQLNAAYQSIVIQALADRRESDNVWAGFVLY